VLICQSNATTKCSFFNILSGSFTFSHENTFAAAKVNETKYLPGFIVLTSQIDYSLNVFNSNNMKLIYKIDRNVFKVEAKLVTGGIELLIQKARKIQNLLW